jgi:virulence-associated protein VagC
MRARAQVIKVGNYQAVRLPKEFRLPSKTVAVERVPQGLLIIDGIIAERRAEFLAALAGKRPPTSDEVV